MCVFALPHSRRLFYINADLNDAVHRELEEETGLKGLKLVQTGAYGRPGRDPRGHTITVAYHGWIKAGGPEASMLQAADDAAAAAWHPCRSLPPLAFDHAEVIADALRKCDFQDKDGGVRIVDRGTGIELGWFEGVSAASLTAGIDTCN